MALITLTIDVPGVSDEAATKLLKFAPCRGPIRVSVDKPDHTWLLHRARTSLRQVEYVINTTDEDHADYLDSGADSLDALIQNQTDLPALIADIEKALQP